MSSHALLEACKRALAEAEDGLTIGCVEDLRDAICQSSNQAKAIEHDCKADDGTSCEECCEHGDTDDYSCLDCGKELTENRMAQAFDRAKDFRKYGG